MPDPRPCCLHGLCCDPPQAARALADELGIQYDAALKVVEAYMLIPRKLPAAPGAGVSAETGQRRLEQLLERVPKQLQAILIDKGYDAGA